MSDELWKQAMDKLKTDRSRFNHGEISNIIEFIHDHAEILSEGSEGFINQIGKDIITYPKYDAIAMWVSNGGLIEYEPELIEGLVKIFGINNEWFEEYCHVCGEVKEKVHDDENTSLENPGFICIECEFSTTITE